MEITHIMVLPSTRRRFHNLYRAIKFMITSLRFLPVCALLTYLTLGCGQLPTRQECIVGYNLSWSTRVSEIMRQRTRSELIGLEALERYTHKLERGMTISPDASRLFMQFARDCDSKETMARNLIGRWQTSGLVLPEFHMIDESVIPSASTIDLCDNRLWRDCPPLQKPLKGVEE